MHLPCPFYVKSSRAYVQTCRRFLSATTRRHDTTVLVTQKELARTRNIGIIAHIDAGKTTTTERMLYYSGYTRRIGDVLKIYRGASPTVTNVDEGSTVTDFLPAERARGITIQSAAISFQWPPEAANPHSSSKLATADLNSRAAQPHYINLIDTPGHADFTFEVLRSVRVLDGAICVLDGVAGVEAQTEKVWIQASHYAIPRLIFVNKLDRDGAAFARTVREIGSKLHCWPAVCQIPWWKDGGDAGLCGIADVVGLRGLRWEVGDGKAIQALSLDQLGSTEPILTQEVKKARVALIELLSEHDDKMVEDFLEYDEDHLSIPADRILQSLRRCTLKNPQVIVPVFAGASFRNIGVQPLLDAVNELLPSPEERPDAEISLGATRTGLHSFLSGKFLPLSLTDKTKSERKGTSGRGTNSIASVGSITACALAFKVVNDIRRGVLVYVRVYSGEINRNSVLFNTNLNVSERAPRFFKMYANDAVEISSIQTGQIGVIAGLKYARTGDTLISYAGLNPKSRPPSPINQLQLRPITVPPPVFFTSIEAASLSEEKHIADTLAILLREDPSLQVTQDEESGQTHLAGMGELHLEIARDRLVNDFKVKADIGKIEIGYRETIGSSSATVTEVFERDVAGKSTRASCTATVSPFAQNSHHALEGDDTTTAVELADQNVLIVHHPTLFTSGEPREAEGARLPSTLPMSDVIQAIRNGAGAALARGPLFAYPLHSVKMTIDFDPSIHIFPNTTLSSIASSARLAVRSALKQASSIGTGVLMEPVMLATISVNESHLGSVVQDITSARGGIVLALDSDISTHSLDSSQSIHTSVQARDELPMAGLKAIYAPPDPFEGSASSAAERVASVDKPRQIIARVPLKEMVGYLKHLRSLTGGRGTFVMSLDGFEKMSTQRQKAVLQELRGNY